MKHWGDFTDDPLSQQNRAKFENFPDNMEPLEKKAVRIFLFCLEPKSNALHDSITV
jgi:hypothetical protein